MRITWTDSLEINSATIDTLSDATQQVFDGFERAEHRSIELCRKSNRIGSKIGSELARMRKVSKS